MTSFPSFDICFRIFNTLSAFLESRAPVGSSAKIISGSFIIALASATLCFCPPDNSVTFLFLYSSNPTFSNADSTILIFFICFTFVISNIIITFSNTLK